MTYPDNNLAAWALAQLVAGLPLPEDFDPRTFSGEEAEAYTLFLNSGEQGAEQLRAWLAQPGREDVRQAVFAHRPGSPKPESRSKNKPRQTTADALAFIRQQAKRQPERDELLRTCFQKLAELDTAAETTLRDEVIDLLTITAGDYRRLLAEARKTKTPAGAPQRMEEVLWLNQPHELRQVMDSVGGVAMTVVPLYVQITSLDPGADGEVQVESERKLMPFLVTHEQGQSQKYPLAEGLNRFNLTLRTGEPPFLLSRWSPEGIRAYLDGYTPNPAQVLAGIESVLAHFVEFQRVRYLGERGDLLELPAEHTQRMVALDIMSTYFMPAWPAVGYPLQTGEKESGKTTCQRIQAALSCMGAHIIAGISTAALKRMADQGFCLYFDDIENINDRNFDADKKAIILAGNTRGVTVPMMMDVDGAYQLLMMRVYCKKGFTNIAGVYDALGTRVLLIPMVKAFDKAKTARDVDITPWPMARQKLIDDLYALALTRMADVERCYQNLNAHPLADRERQIWTPLLVLAELCGGDAMRRQMITLALAKRHERQERSRMDVTQVIVRVLFALVQENPTATGVTPDLILDRAAEFLDLEKETDERSGEAHWSRSLVIKVGMVLSNLGAYTHKRRPSHEVRAAYDLDVDQINRLAISHNLVTQIGD